jgi:hypothetical protein
LEEASVNDPKLYWKTVKLLIKENSNAFNSIPTLLVDENGNEQHYKTDAEKESCLNEYFILVSHIDTTSTQLPVFVQKSNNNIENFTITYQEIIDILSLLPVNKAVGPDDISNKNFKRNKTNYL